jgi:hypothetical protein
MPTYEVVLWFQGHEDVRTIDQPLTVGQTVLIDDIKWLVEAQDLPRNPASTARFICSRRAATSANRSSGR